MSNGETTAAAVAAAERSDTRLRWSGWVFAGACFAVLAFAPRMGNDYTTALLINLLLLLEAKDSSVIENIVTTMDKLFQFAQEDSSAPDAATKEALRYRTALYQGFVQLQRRPLNVSTAIEICSTLKAQEMDIRKIPGTVIANQHTNEIIYTPPVGEEVIRHLLGNWEQYLHAADDIDPLIKMAISHYQFEAIHPFFDGNGRTGRILNVLYLIEAQLLTLPILYLSRYIVQHKQEYYRLLTSMFLHYGVFHLLLNMWALWVVGGVLEPLLGRLRFLTLYLVSGLGGSVAVYLTAGAGVEMFGRPIFGGVNTLTAGASGAVFGLFAAFYIVLRKLRRDTSMITMILVINLIFTFTVPNISVAGHVGGMVTGALIAVGVAYAPREHRTAIQAAAVGGILVILAGLTVLRTLTLT